MTIPLAEVSLQQFEFWIKNSGVYYAVWQHERGKETGYDHIQAYVEYASGAPARTKIQEQLGCKCHMEKAHNPAGAIQYCQKSDTRVAGPWFHGVAERDMKSRTQAREDMRTIKEKILALRKKQDAEAEEAKRWLMSLSPEDKDTLCKHTWLSSWKDPCVMLRICNECCRETWEWMPLEKANAIRDCQQIRDALRPKWR